MDHKNRDTAVERNTPATPPEGPAASSSRPTPEDAATRVLYCCWCKSLTIFHAPANGILMLFLDHRKAILGAIDPGDNGMLIQDGICDACRAKQFPGSVQP